MKVQIFFVTVLLKRLKVELGASPVATLGVPAMEREGRGGNELMNKVEEPMVKYGMSAYLMVLPVLIRIHWGMGRFCFWALPRMRLVLKDLLEGC